MLADQLAPLLELAARKGVDLGLSSLYCYGGDDWQWDYGDCDAETAALIVTGSLSKWLAGQGIAVLYLFEKWWRFYGIKCDGIVLPGTESIPDATDHLSALIAAATARLEEMPDAAGGAESPAASKEGGR